MIAHSTRRRAFTTLSLVEVMVVVTVILVLFAMLLPAVNSASEAARRIRCVNNLVQIGIALQNYETIHGVLPPGVVNDTGPIKNIPKGYHYGWMTQILPLLDRKAVHGHLDYSVSVYDPINMTCRQTLIGAFLCPSDPGADRASDNVALTNYAACHNDAEAPIDTTNNGTFFLEQRDPLRRHHRWNRYDDPRGGEEAISGGVWLGIGNAVHFAERRDFCRKCLRTESPPGIDRWVEHRRPRPGRRVLLKSCGRRQLSVRRRLRPIRQVEHELRNLAAPCKPRGRRNAQPGKVLK